MNVHKSAVISPKAKIAPDVEIGPNVFIDDNVEIESRARVYANAYITGWTVIGEGTQVHMGAVIGHLPQDLTFNEKTKSFVKIGKDNVIREYATIHRSKLENGATIIGNNNFLMAYAHVAHDCVLGDNIIMANNATLGGHVEVEDKAFISAFATMHQFVRVGTLTMLSGFSAISKDVPPYMVSKGRNAVVAYNAVGLKRAGFTPDAINRVRSAYRLLYRSGYSVPHALEEIEKLGDYPEINHLTGFIKKSKRGILHGTKNEEEVDE